MNSRRSDGDDIRGEWLLAVLLVLATLAAYARVRGAGFIWDDEMHLTQNPCIVGPLGLADIWTSRAARYFPLVLTTFWAEHAIWGLAPLPYHVVNVLLHAACALTLWRVLRALRVRGALLGAALWALHPVQVESVAWITELKNTQSCLFYLLAVLFYVKWAAGGETPARLYAAALLCCALAMASKSSTVVLPAVLGLCAWWTKGEFRWRDAAALAPVALLSAAAAALSLWTQHLEGANAPEWTRGMPERIATSGWVFWFYIGKLLWPHPLVFVYPRWTVDWTRAVSYAPTVAMGALLLALGWLRNGRLRPVFFAAAYFFVALVPVLGLLDQYYWRYSFVGDHFQYLASMGPLALAAAAVAAAFDALGSAGRRLMAAACIALLCLLGALSWAQCAQYRDIETLWRTTVALNPGCWMAHNNLGALYMDSGRTADAAHEFQEALDARPDDVEAHVNLANALVAVGAADQARDHYRRALELDPSDEKARNGLGEALLRAGQPAEAITQFREALRINPLSTDAENSYGNALLREGRTDEAVGHYRRAIQADPRNVQAHSNLGAALVATGRPDEALAEYQAALALNPRFATALVNLGNLLTQKGKMEAAASLYQRALEIEPNTAETHNNLGYVLLQEGHLDQAIAECRRALELNPRYPAAHLNLGKALFKEGRIDEADTQLQEARLPR